MNVQPASASAWKNYAESPDVQAIPLSKDQLEKANIFTVRDVYLEYPQFVPKDIDTVRAFADVIALDAKVPINLSKLTSTLLCTRVLTSEANVELEFIPGTKHDESPLIIYAEVQDHPITYSVSGTDYRGTIEVIKKGYVGVMIWFPDGSDQPRLEYLSDYGDAIPSEQLVKSMETQLRIASALFWASPAISISQAKYLAGATNRLPGLSAMNLQAVTLGQQLVAQALTSPNMNYAPVLSMGDYRRTVDSMIKAAEGYETQHHRFEDRRLARKERLEAWGYMTKHVQNVTEMRSTLIQAASGKYDEARTVVKSLTEEVKADGNTLERAESNLRVGIKNWKFGTKWDAAFKIVGAVMEFALAIGMICVGIPSAGAVGAVKTVEEASKAAGEGKKVVSETLKALNDCVSAISKLYPTVGEAVASLKTLEGNLEADVTKLKDVIGGNASAVGVATLAAWDRWILDSDAQLKVAIDLKIQGAAEYRLELRKHAVNAKALVQAQTEAIKAGQEYVHASLEQKLAQRDLDYLNKLQKKWETNSQNDQVVEAMFYDRFMTIRTSIVMGMRNLLWAYKYAALEDSKVVLSVQKTAAMYQHDLWTISDELDHYLERHNPGFTDLTPRAMGVRDLPSPFGSQLIASLQLKHFATFTFAPDSFKMSPEQNVAGPFKDGEHFRVLSLRVFLVGARAKFAKDHLDAQFRLTVSTSGVYADFQDNKMFQFTTKPLTRIPFKYNVEDGKFVVYAETPFESKDFPAPTPFTQWTIAIKNPEEIDLSGLTDVRLEWKAKYYSLR